MSEFDQAGFESAGLTPDEIRRVADHAIMTPQGLYAIYACMPEGALDQMFGSIRAQEIRKNLEAILPQDVLDRLNRPYTPPPPGVPMP